jgi:sugar/nucleoside kinase (ribokinase family)
VAPAALRHTDYCVINEMEAERTSGVDIYDFSGQVTQSGLKAAATKLLSLGVSTWAVIHWRGGAAGMSSSGEWVVRPSIALPASEIITTTGAGDAFAAGVLYAAWSHLSLAEALEAGIGAASGSLLASNASDGVLSFAAVRDLYHSSPHEQL